MKAHVGIEEAKEAIRARLETTTMSAVREKMKGDGGEGGLYIWREDVFVPGMAWRRRALLRGIKFYVPRGSRQGLGCVFNGTFSLIYE